MGLQIAEGETWKLASNDSHSLSVRSTDACEKEYAVMDRKQNLLVLVGCVLTIVLVIIPNVKAITPPQAEEHSLENFPVFQQPDDISCGPTACSITMKPAM